MANDHIEIINLKKKLATIPTSYTFTSLTDVPASYLGCALMAVRVNVGATGLEFYTPSTIDTTAIHKATASEIFAIPNKATPISADLLLIEDSADTYKKKNILVSALPYRDRIQDTATTTYVDTDSTANCVDMKGNGATTSVIMKLKNSSDTEVFQVDGNGSIKNNSRIIIKYGGTSGSEGIHIGTNTAPTATANNSVFIGTGAGALCTVASSENVGIGRDALKNCIGTYNVSIGYLSGINGQAGNYNTYTGAGAGGLNTSGDSNVYNGCYAGNANNDGHRNIYIGNSSGRRQTSASDLLIIDNTYRASIAVEQSNAIIYGTMAATVAAQELRVNAVVKSYGRRQNQVTKTADYNVSNSDECILIDGTSTGVDGTLPAISATNDGQTYEFKVINFTNVPTLITTGTDVFDNGTNTFTFSALNEVIKLRADNTPATKIWRQW